MRSHRAPRLGQLLRLSDIKAVFDKKRSARLGISDGFFE